MELSLEESSATFSRMSMCYSTLIDKTRRAVGTRIVLIGGPGQNALSIGSVLRDISARLPMSSKTLLVAPIGVPYDATLLDWEAPSNVILEVPALMLLDPAFREKVVELHQRGVRLALRGRAAVPLPPEVLPMFTYAVIADSEDRRKGSTDAAPAPARQVAFAVEGVTEVADADAAFMRGAAAIIGWPPGTALTDEKTPLNQSQAIVVRLISMVNQEADVREIDKVLKLDPALSFKLLKLINSPGFGLSTRVSSLQQAVILLGYTKLMRWLSVLMASSGRDENSLPMMHASIRRGLFLEQLGRGASRDGLFITGAFSLLDKMTGTPFEDLFAMISVAPDIVASITGQDGPYSSHLALIGAIEQNQPALVQALLHKLEIAPAKANLALLHALASADALENDLH